MKSLKNYISEALNINKSYEMIQVKNVSELFGIIKERCEESSKGDIIDLNDLDVSKIINMSTLFIDYSDYNFDVSEWDVSNVRNMADMFSGCHNFNCDLSEWNMSNVQYISGMLDGCYEFDSDISKWDLSNVRLAEFTFNKCFKFNCDISQWNLDNAQDLSGMFAGCKKLDSDVSRWNFDFDKRFVELNGIFLDCNKMKKYKKSIIKNWNVDSKTVNEFFRYDENKI